MSLRRWLSLCLICGLWSAGLLAPQPARAQSGVFCSPEGNVASVKAEVILDCLRAGMPVNFDEVTVTGDLDLTDLGMDGQSPFIASALVISNAHFTGSVTAYDGDMDTTLIFREQVDLRGSRFGGVVDFTGAVFSEFARFDKTTFESEAIFNQAVFHKGASFNRAVFQDTATFMMTENQRGFEFMDAHFSGVANFYRFHSTQDPHQPADVLFSGVQFTGEVLFMEAAFDNQVHFNDVIFRRGAERDAVNLGNAVFTTLNLSGADLESEQLDLNGTRYETLIMPNFQPATLPSDTEEETLTKLKDNFRKQGRLDIVNEIAYWKYGIERQKKTGLTPILETVFLDWTFGYGLKPLNAVWTSVILILFFAIFYYPEGVLRRAAFAPSKPKERKFTIRLAELPIAHDDEPDESSGKGQRNLALPPQAARAWRAIVFSFGVFTKLSSGSDVAVRVRLLVIAEWIIGLMVMAGFLFSLANANPLLRSVFDFLK
jgi:uncharacterized protein YjbI with pentapeptide repeats